MTVLVGLLNGMISAATPLLLSSLGGALTYYAGIFNIAMEGMMLSGAFFAVLGSYTFGSWGAGLICGGRQYRGSDRGQNDPADCPRIL